MNELFFQLLSRLGLELPENEGQNPIARIMGTDPYTPDDEPYLRQYLNIPKDGLIPTDLRPGKLTVKDDLPWYRPTDNPVKELLQKGDGDKRFFSGGKLFPLKDLRTEEVDALQPGGVLPLWNPAAPGLGHYTASVGKGTSGRPFLSVYDKWDFESPVVSPLMKAMMSRAGKGFHVYERYPLTRRDGSYQIGGDIELPEE